MRGIGNGTLRNGFLILLIEFGHSGAIRGKVFRTLPFVLIRWLVRFIDASTPLALRPVLPP